MLTQHPDLDGIYVSYSGGPATAVLASLQAAGNTHVKVVTHDLDAANDVIMATKDSNYFGTAIEHTYDEGANTVKAAVLKLLRRGRAALHRGARPGREPGQPRAGVAGRVPPRTRPRRSRRRSASSPRSATTSEPQPCARTRPRVRAHGPRFSHERRHMSGDGRPRRPDAGRRRISQAVPQGRHRLPRLRR